MFEINVELAGQILPRADYSRMTIDEIYRHLSWEANLTITYGNQIFFREEVAIVEFYWYLSNWYREYLSGSCRPFVYSTVEYKEPILLFSYYDDKYWYIDSIWRQFEKAILIDNQVLYSEVSKLVEKLMLAIES